MDDGTKFFEYFRMSENSFNLMLSELEIHLNKTHIGEKLLHQKNSSQYVRGNYFYKYYLIQYKLIYF